MSRNRVTEFEKEWGKKMAVLREVESRRREREHILLGGVTEKLNTEFGAELEAAKAGEHNAKAVYDAENDRVRTEETMTKLPYPLGTILVEWEHSRYGSSPELYKTSNRAVLQIFNDGDPLPANVRWGRPSCGSLVLRSLKKDGTTGAALKEWRLDYEKRWMPEGVEPKEN